MCRERKVSVEEVARRMWGGRMESREERGGVVEEKGGGRWCAWRGVVWGGVWRCRWGGESVRTVYGMAVVGWDGRCS